MSGFVTQASSGANVHSGIVELMEGEVLPEIQNVEWQDIEFEVALDSGCCAHVMDTEQCAPGYEVFESEGSKRGAGFLVGSGARIPNEGEVHLNLSVPGAGTEFTNVKSTFQASPVTRPLMSVSQICRNGLRCVFDDDKAEVVNKNGDVHCTFKRQGGLYVCNMRLKAPTPFTRPA